MVSNKILVGIGAAAAVAVVAVALALAMGSSPAADNNNNNLPAAGNGDSAGEQQPRRATVVASFFPLYDFARQVAGDRADISVMVPVGVEPHDWEPTARQVEEARNADMLVYNGAGFETWVESIDSRFAVNTSEGIELLAAEEEQEEEHAEEGEEEGHEEGAEEEDEHGHGAFDPHIWLDPVLARQQVESIRSGLATVDPANADYYNANAARFTQELTELDAFIESELSSCEKTDFIAFHEAFSYFADRYGLTQHAVHESLTPEGEILPQRLEEVVDLANDLGITVIYSEDLVDPRLAQVIADEIPGGRVLTLSPLEGIERDEQAAGVGYIEKMRENVANLKEGLECS
jgi:zinc transport system substrate-binding protein